MKALKNTVRSSKMEFCWTFGILNKIGMVLFSRLKINNIIAIEIIILKILCMPMTTCMFRSKVAVQTNRQIEAHFNSNTTSIIQFIRQQFIDEHLFSKVYVCVRHIVLPVVLHEHFIIIFRLICCVISSNKMLLETHLQLNLSPSRYPSLIFLLECD